MTLAVKDRRHRRAYWWKGEGTGRTIDNFGDSLTDTILTLAGISHEWAAPDAADLVLTGSVLEKLPCCWPGTVCGAGKLYEDSELHLQHTRILAVRGPLTARALNRWNDVAIGDPGLLAPDLLQVQQGAHYALGVVPHWSDSQLFERFPYGHLISPDQTALTVVREIARCKRVISSSLHGVIIADAFGIPRQLEPFTPGPTAKEGGDFKHQDYHLSIATPLAWGQMIEANSRAVDLRRKELMDALASI